MIIRLTSVSNNKFFILVVDIRFVRFLIMCSFALFFWVLYCLCFSKFTLSIYFLRLECVLFCFN
ncbi:hypothetical protein Hanom_Chr07g00616481 [Helianthus anomalus]